MVLVADWRTNDSRGGLEAAGRESAQRTLPKSLCLC